MIDQQDVLKVKALSPTAARIFIIILLGKGEPFTGRQLAAMIGKSEATVSMAVRELEAGGMAQYNGYSSGWSVPGKYYQPSLLANEVLDFSKTLGGEVLEKSKTLPALLVDVVNSLDSEREDQQQSSVPEKSKTPDHSGTKQRAQILRKYGVSGRAIRRYSHPPCPETAVILAFCWESATMPLNNPGGWINCRLRDGDEPGDDFLDLARFWLALDSDGRADFNAAWYSGRPAIDLADDLAAEFDLSQAAAELAVELRPLKAFEEAA